MLRRSLEKQGSDFLARGNRFLYTSDYKETQRLPDTQLDTRWTDMLNKFVLPAFPIKSQVLGPWLSCYWTMWQSEWAADLIIESPSSLNPMMDSLLRHAFMTGTSISVLRYLDRPVTLKNKPHARLKDEVLTRLSDFHDGMRIRHWVDRNSVKIYNEQNVLRVETTINAPQKFRVHRHKQGQSSSEPKERLPMRKGVADIPLRAKYPRRSTTVS